MTSYTEEAIKDVMLAGVGDDNIKREVVSTENILSELFFKPFCYVLFNTKINDIYRVWQTFSLYLVTKQLMTIFILIA